MSVVTKQVVIEAPIERVYEIVVDYERYPEFVPGIRACRVAAGKGEKQVEYELDLGIRRIKYVLRHEEQRPRTRRVVARVGRHDEGVERLLGALGRRRAHPRHLLGRDPDRAPAPRPAGARRPGERRAHARSSCRRRSRRSRRARRAR